MREDLHIITRDEEGEAVGSVVADEKKQTLDPERLSNERLERVGCADFVSAANGVATRRFWKKELGGRPRTHISDLPGVRVLHRGRREAPTRGRCGGGEAWERTISRAGEKRF